MKIKYLISLITLLAGCATTPPVEKIVAYRGFYEQRPLSILIMPPINRSTNVDAKEYFHSTLNVPISNAGFYVIPPFLSMEIMKNESAYDSELFLQSPLTKFGEVFGADLALFTIIHKWDKSGLAAKVYVEVEYIFKSVKTDEIIYTRRGDVTYDASIKTGVGGALGALADLAVSAINTAATKYVDIGRVCNAYTFQDLPAGKYSPKYGTDGQELAGEKTFKVYLTSAYK